MPVILKNAKPVSTEEVLAALVDLGEDPTVARATALAAQIDPAKLPVADRAERLGDALTKVCGWFDTASDSQIKDRADLLQEIIRVRQFGTANNERQVRTLVIDTFCARWGMTADEVAEVFDEHFTDKKQSIEQEVKSAVASALPGAPSGGGLSSVADARVPPQRMSFAEFAATATLRELSNHGRGWEVFVGGKSLGFADGSREDALSSAHQREVNNALYANTSDAPEWMTAEMPSAAALAEYPQLKAKFPQLASAFDAIDRARADVGKAAPPEAFSTTNSNVYIEAYACDDEGDGPEWVEINSPTALQEQVLKLQGIVKAYGLSEARVPLRPDAWGPPGVEEEMEFYSEELVVTSEAFRFVCCSTHTDYLCETRTQDIAAFVRSLGTGSGQALYFGSAPDVLAQRVVDAGPDDEIDPSP